MRIADERVIDFFGCLSCLPLVPLRVALTRCGCQCGLAGQSKQIDPQSAVIITLGLAHLSYDSPPLCLAFTRVATLALRRNGVQ